MLLGPKILTKIECCRAKYYPGHDLEALDPALVLVVHEATKNNFWSKHKITSSLGCRLLLIEHVCQFQQNYVSNFLFDTLYI